MAMAAQVSPSTTGALDAVEALVSARTAAWRWEIGSQAVEWSPGAAEVLGVPSIVLRSPDLLLQMIDGEDLALASKALDGWRAGEAVNAQVRVHLAGETRWFDVAGRVVTGDDGGPPHATGTLRDVTEDREAQDALLDALRDAEAVLDRLPEYLPVKLPSPCRDRVA